MPATYEAIATQTLGSAAASVTFSSIPTTYTDLVLVADGTTTTGAQNMRVQFNGDTTSVYSRTRLLGGFNSSSSEREANATSMGVGDWGTGRAFNIVHIFSYANTSVFKTVLSRSGEPAYTSLYVGLWRQYNAINSVTFFKISSNLVAGSTFTLYGIKAA
jgi:hypothetical protein